MSIREDVLKTKQGNDVNLRGADLRGADLWGADLRSANLRSANLRNADLRSADLWGANLRDANLRSADLRDANLRSADLRDANLRSADLRSADLRSADLRSADLRSADLRSANLRDTNLPVFQICPEEGDFIVWKKVQSSIIKLLIPADAKRTSSLVGRKCRAEFALVLQGKGVTRGLTYLEEQWVLPDSYDDDIRVECTHGIHFFMTRQEACDYV